MAQKAPPKAGPALANEPLSMVAYEGNLEHMKARLEAGTSPFDPDGDGRTLLHWAAAGGHSDTVGYLLSLSPSASSIDGRDGAGWTALCCAASAGHWQVVSALLDAGASPNVANDSQCIPLHYHRGRQSVAELLVRRTKDVDAQNGVGETPMHRAARDGHESVVRLLLGHGSHPGVADEHGCTPLHYACEHGHAAVARLLTENGARVDTRNAAGRSPAELAPPHLRREMLAVGT